VLPGARLERATPHLSPSEPVRGELAERLPHAESPRDPFGGRSPVLGIDKPLLLAEPHLGVHLGAEGHRRCVLGSIGPEVGGSPIA